MLIYLPFELFFLPCSLNYLTEYIYIYVYETALAKIFHLYKHERYATDKLYNLFSPLRVVRLMSSKTRCSN